MVVSEFNPLKVKLLAGDLRAAQVGGTSLDGLYMPLVPLARAVYLSKRSPMALRDWCLEKIRVLICAGTGCDRPALEACICPAFPEHRPSQGRARSEKPRCYFKR